MKPMFFHVPDNLLIFHFSFDSQTICYSSHLTMPLECSDHGLQGVTCDLARLQTNANFSGCEQHRTCPHCLATFPVLGNKKPICQWCSNCPEGKCMLAGMCQDFRALSS